MSPVTGYDINRPPPMPRSALFFCPLLMQRIRHQAPGMVYGLARDARRDALLAMHWWMWAVWHYQYCWTYLARHPHRGWVLTDNGEWQPLPDGASS